MNRVLSYLGLADEKEVEEALNEEELEGEEVPPRSKGRHKGNVVSLQHVRGNSKMVLVEPRSFNEVQEIADHLRARKAVIINLHRMRDDHARRMIDFLGGTVYALDGSIQKVGKDIYLCAPDNVEVQGNISEWTEGNGEEPFTTF
ncbi:cell division protein SepF [Thermicanus aegyptius]|uniref:cell division protein SepF n=1 Tax=Thermicanus aegyptius TaxID=94009 RepID=UPI00316ABD19